MKDGPKRLYLGSPLESREEGGCNFCDRHSGPGRAYRVWPLVSGGRGGGVAVRFCRACIDDLERALAGVP